MQVQMVNGLAAVIPSIDNYAIALVQLLRASKFRGCSHQMAQQRLVLGKCLCLRTDVLFGYDQQMRRRLRIDVRKSNAQLVFVDTVGWNLPSDDFAKQTIRIHRGTRP